MDNEDVIFNFVKECIEKITYYTYRSIYNMDKIQKTDIKILSISKIVDKHFLNENVEHNKCICKKTIKFKNGMNFFNDFTYNCEMNNDKVSVGYEDGRFTTMSKDNFDNHFQLI